MLKVSHPAEPAGIVAMEIDALAHVHAVDPGLPVPEVVAPIITLTDDLGRDGLARVITLLPGSPVEGDESFDSVTA